MNDEILKLVRDQVIPLILVALAGLFYVVKLPTEFCGAVAGAGLLAFQIHRSQPNPQQQDTPQ